MTAPVTPTGPFVVRHRDAAGAVVYCEAFATLEDAARKLRGEDFFDVAGLAGMPDDQGRSEIAERELDVLLVGATGGRSSATLPNGDVIEVEVTTVDQLIEDLARAGIHYGQAGDLTTAALAAWNAEHGIGLTLLSEDDEAIREVPADVRRAWEPKASGYTAEQAAADRKARAGTDDGHA